MATRENVIAHRVVIETVPRGGEKRARVMHSVTLLASVFGATSWANYSGPCKRVQLRHDDEE
jgi:hypothetical protein